MSSHPVTVTGIWAGDRGRPEFLSSARPVLSWTTQTTAPDWQQRSAQIQIRLGHQVTTHPLDSSQSQRVPWPAAALGPYTDAEVRVRVEGRDGSASDYSPWAALRTGPLTAQDWKASFITTAQKMPERGTIRLRGEFTAPATIRSATLSITAHGVYEAVINGHPVTDELLAPGWTSYDNILTFQTHDVTTLLQPGQRHVIGATVADGWYGERYGFSGAFRQAYPGPLALSAQLRIVDGDGVETLVVTDPHWQGSVIGPVTSASIYQGESFDARLADQGLTHPDAGLPDAAAVEVVPADPGRLTPASSPPVRAVEQLPVTQVLTSPTGTPILDFGQNLVGWLYLTVSGPTGQVITVRHAEVLEDGALATRPLRFAQATDTYTLHGQSPETWSPRFTFHGFRYAEIDGWPGTFDPDDVRAVVVHSDMTRTGHFTTDNPLLNRLHDNVVWGMRGNFLSVPTDCPQRDERLGWTGDIQVFTPAAAYLYDVSGFLDSWLRDLAADQGRLDGATPLVVPNVIGGPAAPVAGWGDAATLVPAALWQRYANRDLLARQYPSMRAWVERIRAAAGQDHLWTGGFQLGDWLDPTAPPDNPTRARTDPDIVATAYYYRSARALAQAADILGNQADAQEYAQLAERIRAAFIATFVTPTGRLVSDAHTAYALALGFDLIDDPELRTRAGARLADLVRSYGYRIATGFLGTPMITDALTSTGHTDTAYRLLLEQECPSWLYAVTMGATTIWERWDSMLPDGSINPGTMTSFNHYAFGAIADWMHRTIAGIAPGAPGYSQIEIAPQPGGGLRHAEATLDTGYGTIRVSWTRTAHTFDLTAVVPPNTTARVHLPAMAPITVGSGEHTWSVPWPEPPTTNPPITLDTSLATLVDDDAARTLVLDCLAELKERSHPKWSSDGRWRPDTTLRQMLVRLPADGLRALETALDGLPRNHPPTPGRQDQ